MKKNKMMRAASVMLVATLATTCAFSGAMAKYVVSDGVTDQARVAKWGVILQAAGNLYGDTYIDTQVANDDTSLTVQAYNGTGAEGDDVVAPGTNSGDPFSISLKGKPEVDGKINTVIKTQNIFLKTGTYGQMVKLPENAVTEANFNEMGDLYTLSGTTYTKATTYAASTDYYTLEDEVTLGDDYFPVIYTLTGDDASTTMNTGTFGADSLAAAAQKLADKLNGSAVSATNGADADAGKKIYTIENKVFESNTDLATAFKMSGVKLTWAWAFEQGADDAAKAVNNGADTILGLLSTTGETGEVVPAVVKSIGTGTFGALTENTDYSVKTNFDITVTVEQLDTNAAPVGP